MVGTFGASPGGRTPPFNGVVATITLRAAFGRRRALLFALPPLILILITLALKAARPPGTPWPGRILGDFGFSVILPLTALIIGTSVLGAEIDDGSIVHLLATPVRRSSVILTKFCVGALLTMAFVAVPELISGIIAAGAGKLAFGLFVGALAGSVIYNALFVMLSVLTTRAIAVGLLYVLVWEAVLGNFVSGARVLSVEQYSLGIANSIAHYSALNAGLTLGTAVIMGAIVTAATLVLATRRLSEFSLKGDAV
jgi:ABC-2 type transport system permease protein